MNLNNRKPKKSSTQIKNKHQNIKRSFTTKRVKLRENFHKKLRQVTQDLELISLIDNFVSAWLASCVNYKAINKHQSTETLSSSS